MENNLDSINPKDIRRLIIERAFRAGEGHIGSALSVADILAVIYSGVIKVSPNRSFDRDMFILSKGHAALALYCTLHLLGVIDIGLLDTYAADGSELGVHPEYSIPGVDFSTGSLGQGLSIGVGCVLATRLRGSVSRTIVLASDAELNEGSMWEAIMFAGHHRLNGLTLIIDNNGQQALGPTSDVIDLESICDKLREFGWGANEVNGHDTVEIETMFERQEKRPQAIVARTISGRGISFMEGQLLWHYRSMNDFEYEMALKELE